MRKLHIYTIAFFICFQLHSQSKNIIGLNSKKGMTTTINSLGDFITGTQFSNLETSTINTINLIGNQSGAQVKTAIYSDSNNAPYQLIAMSESKSIDDGITTMSIPDQVLLPGKYWIMTLYNRDGHHIYSSTATPNNKVFYFKHEFDKAFPEKAENFSVYQGHSFAYFLGSKTSEHERIEFYPNPAQNWMRIKNPKCQNFNIKIINSQGITKTTFISNDSLIELNIKPLQKGNYYLIINNSIRETFVVN